MPLSKVLSLVSILALVATAICLFFTVGSFATEFIMGDPYGMPGGTWFGYAVAVGIAGLVLRAGSSLAKGHENGLVKAQNERVAEARRLADERARRASDQQQLLQSAERANSAALAALERLPSHLENAAQFLKQADIDWDERIFNPFWTSIESCAMSLAAFDSDLENINRVAGDYATAESGYEGVLPPFSVTGVGVDAMDAYKKICDHMSKNTRRALGDIEFANIYENWHGNRIMAAGFKNLRSAINEMSSSIASQISSLSSRVGSMSQSMDSLSGAVNHQSNVLSVNASTTAFHNAELLRAAKDSVYHEKQIANRLRRIDIGN